MPVAHRQRARDTLSCRASAQSAIGVGYNLHRYQGQQQLLVVKARSIDHLSAAAYCGYGDGFDQPENAARYTLGQRNDTLPYLRRVEQGSAAQRQQARETRHELAQFVIVAPGEQFKYAETVSEIGIGEDRDARVFGASAHNRNLQVIGQETNGIEEYPLLTRSAGQHLVDFVEDQDFRAEFCEHAAGKPA